jgi:hypothetical protein
MASIIRIKRSGTAGNPATLASGELAYSALTDNGTNGGDRLYIGFGSETAGNASNHYVVGGKYFMDMLDHTRGILTANSAILVDGDSKIDQIKVGNMTFTGSTNTIITANSNGNLNLSPDGTGSVVVSKLYVTGTTTFNDNVLPTGNGVVNLGSATNRFGTIYLSGATIDIAGQTITANADGIKLSSIQNTVIGNVTAAAAFFTTANLSVDLNATGNVNTANVFNSNLATGTAPIKVVSTTRVANLNVAVAGSLINGNSNVVVAANGNISLSAVGSTNVAVITVSGVNILGNLDVAGNISNVTTVYSNTFVSNVGTGTAPFTVTSTTRVANLNVANAAYADSAGSATTATSATTAGTVTTNAQGNITSLGTLTGLDVNGTATVKYFVANTTANLGAVGNVTITGGSSGQYLKTDGSGVLSWGTVSSTAIANGTSNVSVVSAGGNVSISVSGNNTVTVTDNGANISGYANISGNANVGNLGTAGSVTASTLVSNVATGTAPFTVTSTTEVANLHVANANYANTAGHVTENAQANITSVGTLTNLYVSGAVTASTFTSNIADGTAPFVVYSSTEVANLHAANANYANSASTADSATTAGTVTGNAQGNITSVGTLTGLDVNGNVNAKVFTSNIATGTAPFIVTSTTEVANLHVANANYANSAGSASTADSATTAGTVTGNAQGNITSVGTLTGLDVNGNITAKVITSNISTGTAPFIVTSTTEVANLHVANANYANSAGSADSATTAGTVTGNAQGNITSVGTLTGLDVNGNVNAKVFTSNIATGTAPLVVTSTTRVANLNVANSGTADVAGTVSGNAQANITSVGTLTGLNVNGTATVKDFVANTSANLGAVGNVTITGGSNGQYLQTDGSGHLTWNTISTSSIANGTSNVSISTSGGNVVTTVAGNSTLTITATGANISGTANISGNVNVGNIGTSTLVATTGNIGNLSINGFSIQSTGANQNITIDPNGTGNVDVNTSYIVNLKDPVNAQDAATKHYVDTIASGMHAHQAAAAATNANLANLTGGSVTYDNGTGGVGATLTLGTPLTTVDSYTIQEGDRIIIKNEADQTTNGVYIWTSPGSILTRADDFNVPAEIQGGDFIYIQHGTLYGHTGWVQTQKVVAVGTTPILFEQFSGAGTYSAGTGLTLNGTEFSISTSYVGQTSLTTLGNVTTGTWSANAIGYNYGGTGFSNYAKGDIVYASAANVLAKLTAGVDGQVLQLSSGLPTWGDLDGGTYS